MRYEVISYRDNSMLFFCNTKEELAQWYENNTHTDGYFRYMNTDGTMVYHQTRQ